jgi:hypothetical protein
MRMFEVHGIEIAAPRGKVFEFVREPGHLPDWAHAFVSAEQGRARLETPAGASALFCVRDLQGDVYGLALRMLWNREDAEDATQEIPVRVVTRLSQFNFKSKLKTWVYRIAVNYTLDAQRFFDAHFDAEEDTIVIPPTMCLHVGVGPARRRKR